MVSCREPRLPLPAPPLFDRSPPGRLTDACRGHLSDGGKGSEGRQASTAHCWAPKSSTPELHLSFPRRLRAFFAALRPIEK
eukprot:scaffold109_cov252-Pinguiococcus_pyrenoidosus.AAC.4